MTAGIDRQKGYERALRDAGRVVDPSLVEPGEFTQESGVRAMQALLSRRPDVDAVFVASDLMASGALRCCGRPAGGCPRTSPWSVSTTRPSRSRRSRR